MKIDIMREKSDAKIILQKLTTPLSVPANKGEMAALFLKGGYNQPGYGVPEGAAINGSFALTGNQGYFAKGGKETFISNVKEMKVFFARRKSRLGKPIKLIIKTGIGGQHTPFQGIASGFEVASPKDVKIVGEYELGKDFEASIQEYLKQIGADWEQVAVIPSSKSGSTDETMMVFVEIFHALLKHIAQENGLDGQKFADEVLDMLHKVNFVDRAERPGKDLFKGFNLASVIDNLRTKGMDVSYEKVKSIFSVVLGNMFFETTDRPEESRLSAFIRNSGLDKELEDDKPGFGAMFDNVGGRWTGDLHMMTFLAFFGLDAERYWNIRKTGIIKILQGNHTANILADKILNEGITDIAVKAPDYLFWFLKSDEQNTNESIWQNGFVNLIAVKESKWDAQKNHYINKPNTLIINLSDPQTLKGVPNVFNINVPDFNNLTLQEIANQFAELFTLFYGMTNTIGNRLIARAVRDAGYHPEDVNMNDLNNPATKIVQENLFVRQPYVELGKGLLEKRLKALQEEEVKNPGAINKALESVKKEARAGAFKTNIPDLNLSKNIANKEQLSNALLKMKQVAQNKGRKLIAFIYLEGDKFYELRDSLVEAGIPWVMQGTGDQHISYQQVLSQPQKYLPFFVSFTPEQTLPAKPAIGFAKGYLDNVPSNLVRDYFAEASYEALTELRKEQGGLGLFLRLIDSENNIDMLKQAASSIEAKVQKESASSIISEADEDDTSSSSPTDVQFAKGGIDLGNIDVAATPSSSPMDLPFIDPKSFLGFAFKIIKIEPINNLAVLKPAN